MRLSSMSALFALACSGLVPAAASASPVTVGDTLRFLGSEGTLTGGAFHIDNLANGPGEDFLSFCLQRDQHIDYSSPFVVGGISDFADDAAGPDYLSEETKWIYARFRKGKLATFDSDEIQAAIWKLEDEWDGSFGDSDLLIAQAQAAVAAGERGRHVQVLNLFYSGGGKAQDQLAVPEPATLVLFGLGLFGAARLPRRRKPSATA